MIDKIAPSAETPLADVRDGATVTIGGFGVRKIICSLPRQVDSQVFDGLWRSRNCNG